MRLFKLFGNPFGSSFCKPLGSRLSRSQRPTRTALQTWFGLPAKPLRQSWLAYWLRHQGQRLCLGIWRRPAVLLFTAFALCSGAALTTPVINVSEYPVAISPLLAAKALRLDARGIMMLVVDRDYSMYAAMYNSFTPLHGELHTTFQPWFQYYGYFDPTLCYQIYGLKGDDLSRFDKVPQVIHDFYPNTFFVPVSRAVVVSGAGLDKFQPAGVTTLEDLWFDKNVRSDAWPGYRYQRIVNSGNVQPVNKGHEQDPRYYCNLSDNGQSYVGSSDYRQRSWSGNFLNWLLMTRMDLVRKVLYGGQRDFTPINNVSFWHDVNNPGGTLGAVPTASNAWSTSFHDMIGDLDGFTLLRRQYLPPSGNAAFARTLMRYSTVGMGVVGDIAFLTAFPYFATAAEGHDSIFDGNSYGRLNGVTFCNVTPQRRSYSTTSAGYRSSVNQHAWKWLPLWYDDGRSSTAGAPFYLSPYMNNPPLAQVRGVDQVGSLYDGAGGVQCDGAGTSTQGGGTSAWTLTARRVDQGFHEWLPSTLGGGYAFNTDNSVAAPQQYLSDTCNNATLCDYRQFTSSIPAIVAVCVQAGSTLVDARYSEGCNRYPSGGYKPDGVLQDIARSDAAEVGLVTGSWLRNVTGGKLRAPAASFRREINRQTGQWSRIAYGMFPSQQYANSSYKRPSIVRTLDHLLIHTYAFRSTEGMGNTNNLTSLDHLQFFSPIYLGDDTLVQARYSHFANATSADNFTKSFDCASNRRAHQLKNGICEDWGAPLAQMYLDALNYLVNGAPGSDPTLFSPIAVAAPAQVYSLVDVNPNGGSFRFAASSPPFENPFLGHGSVGDLVSPFYYWSKQAMGGNSANSAISAISTIQGNAYQQDPATVDWGTNNHEPYQVPDAQYTQYWGAPMCRAVEVVVVGTTATSQDAPTTAHDMVSANPYPAPSSLFASTLPAGYSAPDAAALVGRADGFAWATNLIGAPAREGINGTTRLVGSNLGSEDSPASFVSADDVQIQGLCSRKRVVSLDAVHGICPEYPGSYGSYLLAGAALLARKAPLDLFNDRTITGFASGRSAKYVAPPPGASIPITAFRVNTFGVDVGTGSPMLDMRNPLSGQRLIIAPQNLQGVPSAKRDMSTGVAVPTSNPFVEVSNNPVNAASGNTSDQPDFFLYSAGKAVKMEIINMANDMSSGAIRYVPDESTYGNDYEMDAACTMSWVIKNSQGGVATNYSDWQTLEITTTLDYTTSGPEGCGYALSGTYQDGLHVPVGSDGFGYVDPVWSSRAFPTFVAPFSDPYGWWLPDPSSSMPSTALALGKFICDATVSNYESTIAHTNLNYQVCVLGKTALQYPNTMIGVVPGAENYAQYAGTWPAPASWVQLMAPYLAVSVVNVTGGAYARPWASLSQRAGCEERFRQPFTYLYEPASSANNFSNYYANCDDTPANNYFANGLLPQSAPDFALPLVSQRMLNNVSSQGGFNLAACGFPVVKAYKFYLMQGGTQPNKANSRLCQGESDGITMTGEIKLLGLPLGSSYSGSAQRAYRNQAGFGKVISNSVQHNLSNAWQAFPIVQRFDIADSLNANRYTIASPLWLAAKHGGWASASDPNSDAVSMNPTQYSLSASDPPNYIKGYDPKQIDTGFRSKILPLLRNATLSRPVLTSLSLSASNSATGDVIGATFRPEDLSGDIYQLPTQTYLNNLDNIPASPLSNPGVTWSADYTNRQHYASNANTLSNTWWSYGWPLYGADFWAPSSFFANQIGATNADARRLNGVLLDAAMMGLFMSADATSANSYFAYPKKFFDSARLVNTNVRDDLQNHFAMLKGAPRPPSAALSPTLRIKYLHTLGGAVNGSPYLVGSSPNFPNREPVAYVGAANGVVYGVATSTLGGRLPGEIVMGYIPAPLTDTAAHYSDLSFSSNYSTAGADGALMAFETGASSTASTTLLGLMGRGGRGVFALNVTHPEQWQPYPATDPLDKSDWWRKNPLLWEFSDDQLDTTGLMGFPTTNVINSLQDGRPNLVTRLADTNLYAVLPNGWRPTYSSSWPSAALIFLGMSGPQQNLNTSHGWGLSNNCTVDFDAAAGSAITDNTLPLSVTNGFGAAPPNACSMIIVKLPQHRKLPWYNGAYDDYVQDGILGVTQWEINKPISRSATYANTFYLTDTHGDLWKLYAPATGNWTLDLIVHAETIQACPGVSSPSCVAGNMFHGTGISMNPRVMELPSPYGNGLYVMFATGMNFTQADVDASQGNSQKIVVVLDKTSTQMPASLPALSQRRMFRTLWTSPQPGLKLIGQTMLQTTSADDAYNLATTTQDIDYTQYYGWFLITASTNEVFVRESAVITNGTVGYVQFNSDFPYLSNTHQQSLVCKPGTPGGRQYTLNVLNGSPPPAAYVDLNGDGQYNQPDDVRGTIDSGGSIQVVPNIVTTTGAATPAFTGTDASGRAIMSVGLWDKANQRIGNVALPPGGLRRWTWREVRGVPSLD